MQIKIKHKYLKGDWSKQQDGIRYRHFPFFTPFPAHFLGNGSETSWCRSLIQGRWQGKSSGDGRNLSCCYLSSSWACLVFYDSPVHPLPLWWASCMERVSQHCLAELQKQLFSPARDKEASPLQNSFCSWALKQKPFKEFLFQKLLSPFWQSGYF